MPENTQADTANLMEDNAQISQQKGEDIPGLSDDDKAALRYARYLREYDTWSDESTQLHRKANDSNLPPEESRILAQVRRERRFYILLSGLLAILGFLFVLNMITSRGTIWVIWPAFGMAVAVVFYAIQVFGPSRALGDEWERDQVEKRLRQIADRTRQR